MLRNIKIQTKITLWYTLLTATTFLVLSILVYYFAQKLSSEDFYKRLDIRAALMAQSNYPASQGAGDLIKDIRNEYLERLPKEKEYFKEITNQYRIDKIDSLDLPESFYTDLRISNRAFFKNGDTYFAGLVHKQNGNAYLVIVSAQNEYIKNQLKNLRNILLAGLLFSTGFTILLGLIFSKQIFLPIRKMTQKVRDINTENLHLRLVINNNSDEINDLAKTFNNMLDRLETSFESQNNFVSNASHELSTPLTSIIGEAELALQKERSVARYQEAMNIILRDAERLKAIIQSLLNLAQTGFDGKKQQMVPLRADEIILSAKRAVDRIYPDNKVHIDYSLLPENENKLVIKGNENLLTLAVTNIILNACKYSDNKEVIVAVGSSDSNLIIIIKDNGIGIPQEELSYIYDPFFRASNTGRVKGYGIGLPLARNIIRIHKGILKVKSVVNKGTQVEIYLPY